MKKLIDALKALPAGQRKVTIYLKSGQVLEGGVVRNPADIDTDAGIIQLSGETQGEPDTAYDRYVFICEIAAISIVGKKT